MRARSSGVILKPTSFCCVSAGTYAIRLGYRDLEEMMLERGLHVDHTTIYRWVQHYAPELEKRCKLHLKGTTDSWRVDETYVKVKKVWMYLYRAVDSASATRWNFGSVPHAMRHSAKRFFSKTLTAPHSTTPRVITVDKNAAYPKAFTELQAEGAISEGCELTSWSSTSTPSSNKITASSNDASNLDWPSFLLRPRGTRYKDMRS